MTSARYLMTIFLALATLSIAYTAHAAIDPNLNISPAPLTFNDVAPGGTSGPETIRLTNTATSGSSIAINNVGVSDSTNFNITSDDCSGKTLSPNTYCDVAASFTPTQGAGGYFSGFLVFGTSTSSDPIGVSVLRGEAVAPLVNFSATSIAFGNQTVGNPTVPHEVSMKNSGNGTMNITSITTAAPFTVADDCGDTLAPGNRCTISTTFTPAAEGAASGSVSIVTNASSSPDAISLGGTGVAAGQPDVSLSTGSLDFGGHVINTTSAVQTIDMKNTGTVNLTITSITPPAGFASTDNCGNTLAPDATCTIDVTFTPTVAQTYTGNLVVVTNAADSPHNIALEGIGVTSSGPKAVFSQSTLDFGEQELRTPSDPQGITVTNEGDADLVVESVEKTADSTGSYSGEEDCSGRTINPGDTCVVNITFNPQEKGTQIATSDFASNSPDSPQQIGATGIGVRVSGGGCSLAGSSAPNALMSIILGVIPLFLIGRRRG